MTDEATILAVDDEEHILDLISYNLERSGYRVLKALSGEEALRVLDRKEVDLVILDLMLPGIDGIEVLKRIRSNAKLEEIAVLMLTAKNDEISRVVGLELGADDYLGKPFGIHELEARVKAILRRSKRNREDAEGNEEDIIRVGDLVIDRGTYTVTKSGLELSLSRKEFELLYLLASNRGRVLTRETLLERVWGYDYVGETRTVDVHVRNLRRKIEDNDNDPAYVLTVRGVGYKCV